MKQNEKETLLAVTVGIVGYTAIATVPTLLFTSDRLRCEAGLLLGMVMSIAMLLHMNYIVQQSVYWEGHHTGKMVGNSLFRMLIVCGVLTAAAFLGFANPVFILIGLIGLKVSAYLQPVLTKIVHKKVK